MDPNTYWVSQTKNVVDLLVGMAWPAVAFIALLIFRRQIGALLGRIREGEFLGTKVRFDPAEAEPAVDAATKSTTGAPRAAPPYFVEESLWLRDLAKERPELAVLGAYAEIEKVLREIMGERGREPGHLLGMRLIDAALEAEVIAAPVAEAIRSLRRLRNGAAHNESIDTAKALDYVDLCDQVRYVLMWDRGS